MHCLNQLLHNCNKEIPSTFISRFHSMIKFAITTTWIRVFTSSHWISMNKLHRGSQRLLINENLERWLYIYIVCEARQYWLTSSGFIHKSSISPLSMCVLLKHPYQNVSIYWSEEPTSNLRIPYQATVSPLLPSAELLARIYRQNDEDSSWDGYWAATWFPTISSWSLF